MYKDFPPEKLDEDGIWDIINEITRAARNAIEAGFDGVEVHGANGYRMYMQSISYHSRTLSLDITCLVPEQFLSSNINTREDEYGGTPEKRPHFILDLLAALSAAIGSWNIGIRLSPYGLCHQARSTQRLETWSSLCYGIKKREDIGPLSYIHFIEPRWEQMHSLDDKSSFLDSLELGEITLEPFRKIMKDTPFISAGGWNPDNCWDVVDKDRADAIAFGRLFLANPDFVERLREGRRMNAYDRSTFYGPPVDRRLGYTDYPTWEEAQQQNNTKWFGEAKDNLPEFFEKL